MEVKAHGVHVVQEKNADSLALHAMRQRAPRKSCCSDHAPPTMPSDDIKCPNMFQDGAEPILLRLHYLLIAAFTPPFSVDHMLLTWTRG